MRILHTSDWHLGRSLHGADLMPAFELWCEHLVGLVRERGIDAVLISGDVYDRGVPSTQVVELFNRTLTELSEFTTVVLTSGNHDSPLRLGFGAGLMRILSTFARTRDGPVNLWRCGHVVESWAPSSIPSLILIRTSSGEILRRKDLTGRIRGPRTTWSGATKRYYARLLISWLRISRAVRTPGPMWLVSAWCTHL